MSDQENFLARWSRRKLEPAEKKAAEEAPEVEPAPPAEPPPEFDISTLPSLDSIGASSDIRPFLQAGVPSALRHAALRRAWATDPAIRDFVGLNENFWDAAGLEAAPGFGALDANVDVKKLLARVLGDDKQEPQAPVKVVSSTEELPLVDAAKESAMDKLQPKVVQATRPVLQRDENIASQQNDEPSREVAAAKPRRHGGAMPQ